MRASGWQRLWIVLSVLWLTSWLVLAGHRWPTLTNIPRAAVFYGYLPRTASTASNDEDFRDPDFVRAEMNDRLMPLTPEERTGLAAGHALSEARRLQFYAAVDQEVLTTKRTALIKRVLMFEAGPMLALYALGWAVAWIRRGFAGDPS